MFYMKRDKLKDSKVQHAVQGTHAVDGFAGDDTLTFDSSSDYNTADCSLVRWQICCVLFYVISVVE